MSDGGEKKNLLKRKLDGADLLGPLKFPCRSGDVEGIDPRIDKGGRRFKEKHSLDSDEEDDKKEEGVLDEEEIEGKLLFLFICLITLTHIVIYCIVFLTVYQLNIFVQ